MKKRVVPSFALTAAELTFAVGLAVRTEAIVAELLLLSEASALLEWFLCKELALHDRMQLPTDWTRLLRFVVRCSFSLGGECRALRLIASFRRLSLIWRFGFWSVGRTGRFSAVLYEFDQILELGLNA